MENKRAVIYCRVSTKEQVDEGNSLASQNKICRDYALKNGYEIVETFVEQGESAKTTDRTELKNMLAYCAQKKNRINAVIAYKIDRISRNMDDYSYIRIALKSQGIEIKSTSEHFENTPAGRFMENIIANVAQFDNDVRTERSVGGMREATKEGRYVWMAPVGYDNIKIAGKSTIAKNALAPIILEAFKKVAQNECSIDAVYRWAKQQGLVSRNGKPVVQSYFYMMLRNELYTGWILKFGERHKGLFEPIVSEELFNRVQRVIKNRTRVSHNYLIENPDFPLKRFIQHPSGLKLTGCWCQGRNAKYPFYRFLMKGGSYSKDSLELKFQNHADKYRFDESKIKALKESIKENLVKEQKSQHKESERLNVYVEELKTKQSLLIQKNLDGVISNQILQDELNRIDQELIKAEAGLDNIPKTFYSIEDMIDFIDEFLKNPSKTWSIAEPDEKRNLQWFEFPKGLTFDGVNFQTKEISSLFKLNGEFSDENSFRVHLDSEISNNVEITNKESPTNNSIKTKEYWYQIANEIVALTEILKRIPRYPG
jgi:site-specific DNA recombinase